MVVVLVLVLMIFVLVVEVMVFGLKVLVIEVMVLVLMMLVEVIVLMLMVEMKVVLLLVALCAIGANAQAKVRVGIYVESLCPGCQDWITGAMATAMKATGLMDITDIHFVPFGNAKENADGTFTCQHGPNECKGNMIEACAIELYPLQARHWPFLVCLENGTPHNDGPKCATSTQLNWDNINGCYNNKTLSYNLMHKWALETKNLSPPHQYTPWITLNGKPLYEDFEGMTTKICAAYTGPKPAGCGRTCMRPAEDMPVEESSIVLV